MDTERSGFYAANERQLEYFRLVIPVDRAAVNGSVYFYDAVLTDLFVYFYSKCRVKMADNRSMIS